MPFTIDKSSLLIKGRKGDTASFTFNFNRDISNFDVYFYIKKNLNISEPIIEKVYKKPSNNTVTVHLNETDTAKLNSQINSYSTYYWGLKIKNGTDYVQTIIPQAFKNPPMMYIYPEIGGI